MRDTRSAVEGRWERDSDTAHSRAETDISADFNLVRIARHEGAHGAAARCLGWPVVEMWIRDDDGGAAGACLIVRPTGRPEKLLDEQEAVISSVGQRSVGPSAWPSDGDDRRSVAAIMAKYCTNPSSYPGMLRGLEQMADRLMASERFQTLHRDLTAALLRQGTLSEEEVHDVELLGFSRAVAGWEEERRLRVTPTLHVTAADDDEEDIDDGAVVIEYNKKGSVVSRMTVARRRARRSAAPKLLAMPERAKVIKTYAARSPRTHRRLSRAECYALSERVLRRKGRHDIADLLRRRLIG